MGVPRTQLLVLVDCLLLSDLEALGLLGVEVVCVVGHGGCGWMERDGWLCVAGNRRRENVCGEVQGQLEG